MDISARDLEIISHYNRYFGQEARVIPFGNRPKPAPQSVAVIEFAAQSSESDWVYATVGASHEPQPGLTNQAAQTPQGAPPEQQMEGRIELVLLSRESHDDLVDLLESLAVYPFVTGGYFGPGHTVAGSPGSGVVEGSPLTEILLGVPHFEPPDFELIQHADGSHTHLLWVVPIYLSERLYIKEHGYFAFEELLVEKEANTSDLWRASVV